MVVHWSTVIISLRTPHRGSTTRVTTAVGRVNLPAESGSAFRRNQHPDAHSSQHAGPIVAPAWRVDAPHFVDVVCAQMYPLLSLFIGCCSNTWYETDNHGVCAAAPDSPNTTMQYWCQAPAVNQLQLGKILEHDVSTAISRSTMSVTCRRRSVPSALSVRPERQLVALPRLTRAC